jgi:hypothetical protein
MRTNRKKQPAWVSGMLRDIANEQSKKHAALRAESALISNLTPQEMQAWVSGILRDIARESTL